jgi:nicotinamidase/pyrazinamidase
MTRYGPGVALLVVDVQNDFADPHGSLPVHGADAVIPAINREISQARATGAMVVYSQDWHPSRTPHFKRDGGPWPSHCVADTWGAEFHPSLDVPAGAPVIRKGTYGEDGYSAFTMRDPATGATVETPLGMLLNEAGVDRVVVVGFATDYCVAATAHDAIDLGLGTTVLAGATMAVDVHELDGQAALDGLRAAGYSVNRRPQNYDWYFANAQLIVADAEGRLRGASDPRKDGGAAYSL